MRMTELKDEEETDSGILEDRNSDSLGSDSNSTGSDSNSIGSNSSTSNLLDDSNAGLEPMANKTGMRAREVETGMENGIETKTTIVSDTAVTAATAATADNKMTIFVQMLMLRLVARPVMLPQLIQYTSISNKTLRTILRWTTRLIPVFVFIVILACMSGAMSQLKPSDHPPQFFDPDSNIQKMLDLEGNLTQRSAVNCWDCSAWYGGSGGGGGGERVQLYRITVTQFHMSSDVVCGVNYCTVEPGNHREILNVLLFWMQLPPCGLALHWKVSYIQKCPLF